MNIRNIFHKFKAHYLLYIFVAILLFFTLYQNGKYRQARYDLLDYDRIITNDQFTYVNDYSISENRYLIVGDMPQLGIVDTETQEVSGIKIVFSEPLQQDTVIQIYYSEEELEESKSRIQTAKTGADEIAFHIPRGQYRQLRFDIKNNFALKEIQISHNEPIVVKKDMTIFNTIMGIMIFFGIGTILIVHEKREDKHKNIKVNIRKIFIWIGLFILICTVILVAENVVYEMKFLQDFIYNRYSLIFSLCISAAVTAWLYMRNKFDIEPEKIFWVTAVSLGILYACAMPIWTESTWDARIHYLYSVELSHLFEDQYAIPEDQVGYWQFSYNIHELNELTKEYDENFLISEGKYNDIRPSSLMQLLEYVPYVIYAIALFVGRGIGLTFHNVILLAQITNVFCYATILYCAMKKIKKKKMLIAVIGLYPTNIIMAASFSYDPWVTCWCILGMSYLVENIRDKSTIIKKREIVIILISFFLACIPKEIYCTLILLCLFIPKTKFGSQKEYIQYNLSVLFMIGLVVIMYLYPNLRSGSIAYSDTRGGEGVNASQQIVYILSYPFEYTKTLLSFLKDYWSSSVIKSCIDLAYLGFVKGAGVIWVLQIVIALISSGEKEQCDLGWKFSVAAIGTVIMTSALIATALYITFTNVGADYIGGVSPRYIIPLLFPLLISLKTVLNYNQKYDKYINAIVFGVMLMILANGIWESTIVHYTI